MSITRPSEMTEEMQKELLKHFRNSGGKVVIQDPMVTKAVSWIVATAATLGLGFIGWLAISVNDLAVGLKENTTELRASNRRLDDFRNDYAQERAEVRQRLSALESGK